MHICDSSAWQMGEEEEEEEAQKFKDILGYIRKLQISLG